MTKYEGAYEYETTVSMPYISFDYINTKNNKNFSGGFPFVCRIKNDDKLKTGDIKKLSYTYDELNEKNLIQKFNFSSYDTIKEYYKTLNQDYVVSYDDTNKKIELKECRIQYNATYEFGPSMAIITCSNSGIDIEVTIK